MQIPRTRSIEAFTLIEVVLASLVLVFGLVGVIQAISSGIDMTYISNNQNIASRIIHSEIDRLRVNTWEQIAPLPSAAMASIDVSRDPQCKTLFYDIVTNTPNILKIVQLGNPVDPSFTCTRTVENVSGLSNLRKITFTVTWRNIKDQNHPHSRSGFTYFAQNGLYVAFQRS